MYPDCLRVPLWMSWQFIAGPQMDSQSLHCHSLSLTGNSQLKSHLSGGRGSRLARTQGEHAHLELQPTTCHLQRWPSKLTVKCDGGVFIEWRESLRSMRDVHQTKSWWTRPFCFLFFSTPQCTGCMRGCDTPHEKHSSPLCWSLGGCGGDDLITGCSAFSSSQKAAATVTIRGAKIRRSCVRARVCIQYAHAMLHCQLLGCCSKQLLHLATRDSWPLNKITKKV